MLGMLVQGLANAIEFDLLCDKEVVDRVSLIR